MFTQTIPLPPPGAGVVLSWVDLLSAAGAAAGAGVFFGLSNEPSTDLGVADGEAAAADAAGDGDAFFRARCSAGEAEAIALLVGDGEASAFLRPRVLAGEAEASGLVLAAGEASSFLRPRFLAGEAEASGLVAGAGEVSVFLRPRFFAGEADASGLAAGDSAGLCASARETQAKIVMSKSRARLIVMRCRLEARVEFRQR